MRLKIDHNVEDPYPMSLVLFQELADSEAVSTVGVI